MSKKATTPAKGTKKGSGSKKTSQPATDQTPESRHATTEPVAGDDNPLGADPDVEATEKTDAQVKQENARDARKQKAFGDVQPATVPADNPPAQPVMIPATQIHAVVHDARPPAAPRARPGAGIKVEATKLGYHGDKLQRVGDVFSIGSLEEFSDVWMRHVPDDTREHTTSSNADLKRHPTGQPPENIAEPRGSHANPLGAE